MVEVKVSPNGVAVDALKELFARMNNTELLAACEEAEIWEMFTTEQQYPEAFTILAR